VVSYAVNSIGWPLGLRVLHCNDVNCSGGDESLTLPDNALSGNYSSISLDSGGNPVISYAGSSGRLSVLHCDDPNCAGDESGHIAQPDSGDIGGWFTSLALDAIGRPIVSYYDYPNHDLRILRCNDPNCVAGGDLVSSPDTGGHVGTFSSLELDPSGNPVVSYVDDTDTNKYLKILHCSVPTCILDTDSDHCPDTSEQQTAPGSQTSGGLRNPKNPWDYMNPSHDGKNRVDDIVMVSQTQYFKDDNDANPGLPPYAPGYNPDTDRTLAGPNLWNTGPPNGLQRVDDIVNMVNQYYHDCGPV
jgi:hypothetical protein